MTDFFRRNISVFRWALDDHNSRCPVAATAFLLNPDDFEKFGERKLWGLEIRPDERVITGFVQILCDGSAWQIEEELENYVLNPAELRPAGHPLQ